MRRVLVASAFATALAACGGAQSQAPAGTAAAGPVETRAANAPDQKPAFDGQTRAPAAASNAAYDVQTIAQVEKPWGMAFLPDGRLLVTEKAGRLRILGTDGKLSAPVEGVPAVDARGQGGLLGLAVDPGFATNGLVYWAFSEAASGGANHTAVARGRLDGNRLTDVKVIFRQTPSIASTLHYGGRLVFARDGTLFVTLGERSIMEGRMQAQRMDGTIGKVVRINTDGSIPKDNPFVGKAGTPPEIWSIGHRNIQSAALDPATGELWEVEHGARGGDELNKAEKGKDYGWPTITYGVEYAGGPIGEGITAKAGMEQPVYYWDPVIAPSGMAFYEGAAFPAWKGSVLVGALGGKHVARLVLNNGKVVGEERLFTELKARIRDVIVGPDGAVWLATDSQDGQILKVVPKG